MKKKPNLNRAGNMNIDAWRERQIKKWTQRYIEERDRAFQNAHAADTDQELREYVHSRAEALGYMPHPLELQGGIYLRKRLGDWNELALELGLHPAAPHQGEKAYLRLRQTGEMLFIAERKAIKTAKNQNRPVKELLPRLTFTEDE